MDQRRYGASIGTPADLVTKPSNNIRLVVQRFVISEADEQDWPSNYDKRTTDEEIRMVGLHSEETVILLEANYSNWNKLLKHVTYSKKFVDFIKDRKTIGKTITYKDTNMAKDYLYKRVQWEEY